MLEIKYDRLTNTRRRELKKDEGDAAFLRKMPRRQSLFWDVDLRTVNPREHARFIIERIIEFGNDMEARWMWRAYPKVLIRDVVKKNRGLNPKSRTLWELLTR